jgi:sulfite reductase (NADPH) flavoprotein alpha-component
MTLPAWPTIPSILPESAPFTAEQRTWLNGFFAGFLSLDGAVTPLSPEEAAQLMPGLLDAPPPPGGAGDNNDDEETPWHDPAILLAERMKLAEGRALRQRLMAAMAQQDCGQCGYNCRDYSNAIFRKQEERLNLCVPGGKETARTLKTLYVELDKSSAPAAAPSAALTLRGDPGLEPRERLEGLRSDPGPEPGERLEGAAPGCSRDHPAEATFLSRTRLNKLGSEKETWHLEFDLNSSGLDYAVGDSLGVYTRNDPQLVDAVIAALKAPPDFPIGGRTLRETLIDGVSLGAAPDMLFQLFSYITGGTRRQKAKALASGEDPDGDVATLDVLAAIEKFQGVRPDPEAFIEALDPLQPRLYSISSSPKANAGRVSLTVDAVRYRIGNRTRLGVASTWFADRLEPGAKVRIYVQKAQHFGLPADPATPIVMIGPGTGVAPFRAFLYERMATKAPGRNWLFFGHQHRDSDFFYEDELAGMKAAGVITHLYLAWSRDDTEKFYVQDRMRQAGRDLWAWIAEGAFIYVCGAIRMGKDVERALVDIVAEHGARSTNEAVAFVADLKKKGRYLTDVY